MKTLLFIMALLGPIELEKAIVMIAGASAIEELSQEELERFQSLADHPVNINIASRSRLMASGLFSQYQVASLLDYRSSTGDILSFAELGLVDGFSESLASALSHFVRLESSRAPGAKMSLDYHHTFTARGSANTRNDPSYRVSYSGAIGDVAELNLTTPGTVSSSYYGRRHLGKVVLGHFNARFGQGLAQWSGFSLSRYSSVSSFSRNGSGFSPTSTSSPELLGAACDFNLGRWSLGAGYSFTGNLAMLNASCSWRRATVGTTLTSKAASVDWRLPLREGVGLSGELACDWSGHPSAIVNAMISPGYGKRIALSARWMDATSKEWTGLAAGYEGRDFQTVIDAGVKIVYPEVQQYRILAIYSPSIDLESWVLKPYGRIQLRYRPDDKLPLRSDARAMISAECGRWFLCGRTDFVYCASPAVLAYAEAAYKVESLQLFLRAGAFMVDTWDDRIYVYERDAPGGFNVPAYYGRGWNASFYGAWKINKRHSLWLRLEVVDYPWNIQKKDGKAGLRLQYRWKI